MIATATTWIGAALLVVGCLLTLVAAVAMLRFPDLFSRQHAATKPQVLGTVFVALGVAMIVRQPTLWWAAVLMIAFQLVTAPISAHLLGRAGYRTGQFRASSSDE